MALPQSAKLPMLLAAALGVCTLGADIYLLTTLHNLHAGGLLIAGGSVTGLSLLAVATIGFIRSWRFLRLYARELAALPDASAKLSELAQDVERHVTEGAKVAPRSLSPDTPLLDRRIKHTWRALQRGAPVASGDVSHREERHSPGPERELRMQIDIAVYVGIAGTLLVLLVSLGMTEGSLLARLSPAMTCGLATVVACISLRICMQTVSNEQDRILLLIDDAVSDSFIVNLPKSVTSPEDRLASASEQLAQDTREILEYSFEKHNAATVKLLAAQAVQSDNLLKEHALVIGQVLTKQVQQPIQLLAEHAGALVQQTAAWAAVTADLRAAHSDFLALQRTAHETHEATIAKLFAQHRASLDDFLEMARQANHVAIVEMQEAANGQIKDNSVSAAKSLLVFREEFAVLIAEQEAAHRRVTEAALVSIGGAIEQRLVVVDQRIAATLSKAGDRLPEVLRDGMKEGLDETIAMLEALREQAAALAHTVAQVSGNADRQLLAYERWQDRANTVQAQLEQIVSDASVVVKGDIR